MSDAEAYATFKAVRFADNGGEAFCPHCECDAVYEYESRRIFKCKQCERQFSLTSGTIFSGRKLVLRDILVAIALFVNGANGHSALRLGRDLNVSYKTAFVMLHKLRAIMGALRAPRKLKGIVEIDGVWVGGHVQKANLKENRKDRRGTHPKRLAIVTLRERREGGRSLTFALKHEAEAVTTILAHVDRSATIVADEAAHWGILRAYFEVQQINHQKAYSLKGIHTNNVESFNSRVRRAERGVYHHIAGRHVQAYANEISWREDHRRHANGTQFATILGAAARLPSSDEWRGYWQRHLPKPPTPRAKLRLV
ncbi:transposase [Caulobacter sp. AP07]|nr:transposase [Caulobacter sp. AP07]